MAFKEASGQKQKKESGQKGGGGERSKNPIQLMLTNVASEYG